MEEIRLQHDRRSIFTDEDLAKYVKKFSQENPPTIPELLEQVDYRQYTEDYVPSPFALKFVNFIKLVNDGQGQESITPLIHYVMLDKIAESDRNIANLVFRGASKTTIFGLYMILFLAFYGYLKDENDPKRYAVYVTDTIENGVATMKRRLENTYNNSQFLQRFLEVRLTSDRWYFKTKYPRDDGKFGEFMCIGYGALTGIRGTEELGTRPQLALIDDLFSDKVAASDANIELIKATLDQAVRFALHPKYCRIIWNGTPFRQNDPLYAAVESGAFSANVFPLCNEFPVREEDFVGAWEDRFDYEYAMKQYVELLQMGNVKAFYQEMMLQITSEEDRLIHGEDIIWYEDKSLDIKKCNVFITSDYATTEEDHSDYSVILVWALDAHGDYHLVDGLRKRQLPNKTVDALIAFAKRYKPESVGIEISGQQNTFLDWIYERMGNEDFYFPIAHSKGSKRPGIRPTTDKFRRFLEVVPLFNLRRIKFPVRLKGTELMNGILNELHNATRTGFKSAHDDTLDAISMIQSMYTWKPIDDSDPDVVTYKLEQEKQKIMAKSTHDEYDPFNDPDLVMGGDYYESY